MWFATAGINSTKWRTMKLMLYVENAGEIALDATVLFEPVRRGTSAQQSSERTNLGLRVFNAASSRDSVTGDVKRHTDRGRVWFTIGVPKIQAREVNTCLLPAELLTQMLE